MKAHAAWVTAIAAALVLWQAPLLRAAGHGPVFGATTPTLGRGGWSVDQAFTIRIGDDAEHQRMLKTWFLSGSRRIFRCPGQSPWP